MIAANDLRIGNYFIDTVGAYANKNTIQRVEVIDREGVNRWQDMGASGCCPFDKMGPIPITPEILEKCGFKKTSFFAFKYHEIYELDNYDIFKIHKDVDFYFAWDSWMNYVGRAGRHTKLKYLHQLQNLFFALCGKELEYKP